MNRDFDDLFKISKKQSGFTLIEIMIAVTIIGLLAAIAYPSYERYVIESKRTDMMSEMHNIALKIQSRKLAQGSYSNDIVTGLGGDYPKQGDAYYQVTFDPDPLDFEWTVIATPIPKSQMDGDGVLSLNYQGLKCRDSICGDDDAWN